MEKLKHQPQGMLDAATASWALVSDQEAEGKEGKGEAGNTIKGFSGGKEREPWPETL